MFAIITQLQLPQSCRHSNGAECPSRAAKWQEGVWALWAGRGGGGTSPRRSPTGSLCQLPHPLTPSPEARGWGLCLGTGRLARPRGGSSRHPIPAARARGARGSRCQEGQGHPESLWLRAQLGACWCPAQLLAAHSGTRDAAFPLQRAACGRQVLFQRVFMTPLARPSWGPLGARHESSLGQDWLWVGGLPVAEAWAQFPDPALMTPIPRALYSRDLVSLPPVKFNVSKGIVFISVS